ncbi:MAG: response regulator transcription factor [Chlorobiales bacterium]|nr:response regulator transcription factor [Chlorobiales bacterium]
MRRKVLIIDDEPSMLKVLSHFLSKHYDVISRADGLEALQFLQGGQVPDMIVADVMMPNIDGYEFIKNVRASGFFKDIPLIMLSSNEKSDDRIKCLKLGADDYLTKPFNPEELLARIQSLFRRVKV